MIRKVNRMVTSVVREREMRLRDGMRMMGHLAYVRVRCR